MNRKHKHVEGAAPITAWFPGNLIAEIEDAVAATGQKRSYVIAEAVRLGLSAARQKCLESKTPSLPTLSRETGLTQ